jgi:ubiquinone/menaquinone biosynthesis C-methylase UbiE
VISRAHWKDHWEIMGKSDSNGRTRLAYDSAISSDIHSKLELQSSDSILNIGCGTGILEKSLPEYHIISIDFASSMLERVWITCGIRASASFLPFRAASFDKICVYSVIQYLLRKQLSKMLAEISRCLISGGMCLIGDIQENGSGMKNMFRGAIGRIAFKNHFEYHSVDWISHQCENLRLHCTLLGQSETLPFFKKRKDLLMMKIA